MKKMLFASIVLLSVGLADARQCGRRRCNRRTTCATTCAPVCAPVCEPACEPVAPRCCKTVKVPTTVMIDQVVEVPARRIEMPVQPIIERIAQAPIEVRTPQPPIVTPQPDLITYQCVPDKVVVHPQPNIVRYECPADCEVHKLII